MKALVCSIFLLTINLCVAQKQPVAFSSIDRNVQFIEEPSVDSLAKKLTSSYISELQKVRAIFSWITQHIEYNTNIFSGNKHFSRAAYFPDVIDTSSIWRSGEEIIAQLVLQRRTAVCDGYAKLFKVLCDKSGLQAEVITGYAKCYMDRGTKFRTNHSWNAVMIDSTWYLIDVTWASGYINYANEFVQHTDDSYFLTPPILFIADHYPEDLRWTLLESPPAIPEFRSSPFRYKSFVKYGIIFFTPSNGTVEGAIGDTIKLELHVKNAEKDKNISPDPFFDSAVISNSPSSVFLRPSFDGNKITYRYIITASPVQWIHILYNNDPVLRYKLTIKQKQN